MRLGGWMGLIAALVGVGMLRVGERTAIVLGGYAVGDRLQRVHEREIEVAWLSAGIAGLASPPRLAEVVKERRLDMVARSMLPAASGGAIPSPSAPTPTLQLAAGPDTAD
jgi:hypothetical protein